MLIIAFIIKEHKMLYKSLNKYDLQKEFKTYDRDYFSLEGYAAILEMFEDLDTNSELDVIAISCEFSEDDEEYIRNYYNIPEDEEVEDYLKDNTLVYKLDNGNFLYQQF
jgi:hypothetical protein